MLSDPAELGSLTGPVDVWIRRGGLRAAFAASCCAAAGARVVVTVIGDLIEDGECTEPSIIAPELDVLGRVAAARHGGGPADGDLRAMAWRERLLRAAPHLVRPMPLQVQRAPVDALRVFRRCHRAVEDSTLPAPAERSGGIELWAAQVDRPRLALALFRQAAEDGARLVVCGREPSISARVELAAEPDGGVAVPREARRRAVGRCELGPRVRVGSVGTSMFQVRDARGAPVVERWRPAPGDPSFWENAPARLAVWAERFAAGLGELPRERPGRWRRTFAGLRFLPGGGVDGRSGPHDPLDPLWSIYGAELPALQVAAERHEGGLLGAQIDHAIDRLGAKTWRACLRRIACGADELEEGLRLFERALARRSPA